MSIVDIAREGLKEKLEQCTPEQINLFNRMYGSIETIPFEKMEWAEHQIDRTLEKNSIQA